MSHLISIELSRDTVQSFYNGLLIVEHLTPIGKEFKLALEKALKDDDAEDK